MSQKLRDPPIKLSLVSRHAASLGGLEKQLLRIANAFASLGIEVDILHSHFLPKKPIRFLSQKRYLEKKKSKGQIHYHPLPIPKWPRSRSLTAFDRACANWHRKHPRSIIFGVDRIRKQTHLRAGNGVHRAYLERSQALLSPLYRLKTKCSLFHHTLLNIERSSFEDPKLQTLFTNSEMVKREILSFYRVKEEKICVIHNGVEWKELRKPFSEWEEGKKNFAKKVKVNPSHYHFLFIGNGYRRKGLLHLLQGFANLSLPDCHLSIVGKEKNIAFFQQQCHYLGIKDKVTFFGPQSDTYPFYQLSDCLVIPSLYDPFANVTVEALAMGLYVVSSPFNGGKEVLNRENGTVIEDLFQTESVISSLLLAYKHRKTTSRAARIRHSIQHLDFSSQLSRLTEITLHSTAAT